MENLGVLCLSYYFKMYLICFTETREDRNKRLFRHYTVGLYDNFTSYRYSLCLHASAVCRPRVVVSTVLHRLSWSCHRSLLCHVGVNKVHVKRWKSAVKLLPSKGMKQSVYSALTLRYKANYKTNLSFCLYACVQTDVWYTLYMHVLGRNLSGFHQNLLYRLV